MTAKTIRVIIADDHAVVRSGIRQILSDAKDITVAAEASTGPEALDRIYQGSFDVALLDITMPGMSGLDVLKELKREMPQLPVLILSMHPEEQFALRAIKAGAAGYINKSGPPAELITAVRKAASGGKYITEKLAERMAMAMDSAAADKPSALDALSDRELQVLRLLATGKSATDISAALNLSIKTVSTYRSRILTKLNLANNSELIRFAIDNKIVE